MLVDPDNPDDIRKYPDSYKPQMLSKTISRDIFYLGYDGNKLQDDIHQEVLFKGEANLDLVTGNLVNLNEEGLIQDQEGKITWIPSEYEFPATDPINSDEFEIVGYGKKGTNADVDLKTGAVSSEVVTAKSSDRSIALTLKAKNDSFAKVTPPESVDELLSDTSKEDQIPDRIITGHQTVRYLDEDDNDLRPLMTTNEITFGWDDQNNQWDKETATYDEVVAPAINGYVAKEKVISGAAVTPDSPDQTIIFNYQKVGRIVPTDSNGNPLPKGLPVSYQNDENDPTQVLASEQVPEISGWKPAQETVTPKIPTEDTFVIYTKEKTDEPEKEINGISLDDLKMIGLTGLKINNKD